MIRRMLNTNSELERGIPSISGRRGYPKSSAPFRYVCREVVSQSMTVVVSSRSVDVRRSGLRIVFQSTICYEEIGRRRARRIRL